jgi:hypothetical protein
MKALEQRPTKSEDAREKKFHPLASKPGVLD